MSTGKRVRIVGGGLAGLTLGIGLRQRGVPLTVWEAGQYPRHRVCGEFVCGRGQGVLGALGLSEVLADAGAEEARTAAFFFGSASSPGRAVTPAAMCLSRFRMDATLAEHLRKWGGEVREQQRWQGDYLGEGVVRTTGRRLADAEDGWHWLGLKVHARSVTMAADLEMHAFRNGYVGLCRLGEDRVNVCGLFRRRTGTRSPRPHWAELLRGPQGSALRARLGHAVFDESSFCSVAGFSLRPHHAVGRSDCSIGDALTMIPPVTGNGMSMAFESAALAIEPLAAWSEGSISWQQARQQVAQSCDKTFARRLAWARWLQCLMFLPVLRTGLGGFLLRSEWVWRTLFSRTR